MKINKIYFINLLFLGLFLTSCHVNVNEVKVGESTKVDFDEGNVAYIIKFIEKNDEFLTLNIKYEGTVDNNYEFIIKDNKYISYVVVDGTKIEHEGIQSVYYSSEQYVLPFFEEYISVDLYYDTDEILDNWESLIIKKEINNNSDGYAKDPELIDELERYGISFDLK